MASTFNVSLAEHATASEAWVFSAKYPNNLVVSFIMAFNDIDVIEADITTGTSLSAEINFGVKTLVAISMPTSWTTAGLSFQASYDGGTTFQEVFQSGGTALSYSVAANNFVLVDPTLWKGVNALKVRSGTSGVPVVQTSTRKVLFLIRGLN